MIIRLFMALTCLLVTANTHAQQRGAKKGFFSIYRLAVSATGGYSGRNIDNPKTILASERTAQELNFSGYKTGLQVLLTMVEADNFLNRLSTGIRADYFSLKEKPASAMEEKMSLFYIGLVEGGLFPLTPTSPVNFKFEVTIGFAEFKNSFLTPVHLQELRGQGLAYGLAPGVGFQVGRQIYLNLGADILTANINSKINKNPDIANTMAKEEVTLISGVVGITMIL